MTALEANAQLINDAIQGILDQINLSPTLRHLPTSEKLSLATAEYQRQLKAANDRLQWKRIKRP